MLVPGLLVVPIDQSVIPRMHDCIRADMICKWHQVLAFMTRVGHKYRGRVLGVVRSQKMNGLCDSLAGLAFTVTLQIGQAIEIAHVYPDLGEKLRLSKIRDAVNLDFQFMQPEPDFRRDYRLAAAQVKSHLREYALSQQRRVKSIEGAVIPSVSAAEEKCRIATFARNPPDPTFKWSSFKLLQLANKARSLDPKVISYM